MQRQRGRRLAFGAVALALVALIGVGATLNRTEAMQGDLVWGPIFEVDPLWPKPLPNHWLLGTTIGVSVDNRDHIWIVHRGDSLSAGETPAAQDPPNAAECCFPAPPVLEFDQAGTLVGYWGGPGEGYEWPASNHGIWVDHMDNVWVGGNGGPDSHLLKFDRTGNFLLQVGRSGGNAGSNDSENFGRVAKIFVDPKDNEAYIADGYLNKRVAVLDAETGAMKRFWGAYGNTPDDADLGRYDPDAEPAQQFRTPVHCADLSNDGLVYACDRVNNRIQVFQKDGTFVEELIVARETLGAGSAWDVAFSRDADQKYLYMADGVNEKVYVIDRREMEVISSFGDGGRQPGQFYGAHSIATDSSGNIYTTETFEGKRVQKFVYKGEGPIRAGNQGVVWPSN
jgi:DNA-binding beta-propeller fold protein YncE